MCTQFSALASDLGVKREARPHSRGPLFHGICDGAGMTVELPSSDRPEPSLAASLAPALAPTPAPISSQRPELRQLGDGKASL